MQESHCPRKVTAKVEKQISSHPKMTTMFSLFQNNNNNNNNNNKFLSNKDMFHTKDANK